MSSVAARSFGVSASVMRPTSPYLKTPPLAHSTTSPIACFLVVATRRGLKPATIAVAHTLLVIADHVLRNPVVYRDWGADYFDRLNPEHAKRYLLKRLQRLSFQVTIVPAAQPA